MKIDVLARKWGGPQGGPDGMAIACARLAWTLAELGHSVRGYATRLPGWKHALIEWRERPTLIGPDDWSADIIITAIAPTWRRLVVEAEKAGALGRVVFWHHHGEPPSSYSCMLAAPPAVAVPPGWRRSVVLPPSSWPAETSGEAGGRDVLVCASRLKGGHVALEVARACPELRFFVLRGRATDGEVAAWRGLPNVAVADGHVPPEVFLARARAVLLPTRAEVHPLLLVEAAVRGIPIVATDLPGCRAAAPESTFLPVAAPPPAWTSALRAALAVPPPARLQLRPYGDVVSEALETLAPAASARLARRAPQPAASPTAAAAPATRPPAAAAPPSTQPVRWRSKPIAPRPRVLVLADIPGHAWDRKAHALAAQLGDRFTIEIAYTVGARGGQERIEAQEHDLYHTFEVHQLGAIPEGWPCTTGITAHVWRTWGEDAMRAWAARAIGFHANSVLLSNEMKELLDRPIWYVPNGVDETFFHRLRPRAPSPRLVVGFVGKPNPRKGRHLVEEACARAGCDFRLVERKPRENLGAAEMREFYQDLDVLAVASDMDGTPNPALEAAACGVTIVSTRIGNMPEFIASGVNGILVERSTDSLAAAFASLDARPRVEVHAMGEAARATIEAAWTWARQAENYSAMWSACLGVAGARRAA